jgi:AcrR family transcriptional regulator
MDPRANRQHAKEERLARATVSLALAAGSLDVVPIEAITTEASMSRRSFFNHFPSKESALLWPLGQVTERLFTALRARPDGEPVWDSLEAATLDALLVDDGILQLAAAADRVIEATPALVNAEITDEPASRHFDEIVRRCGRDPRSDPYPHLVGTSSYAILRIALKLWVSSDIDPRTTVESAFALARGGLA